MTESQRTGGEPARPEALEAAERADLGPATAPRSTPAPGSTQAPSTTAAGSTPGPSTTTSGSTPAAADPVLEPLAWSSGRIVLGGLLLWAVALVVTLVVPSLHTGERDWWPWTCVAGLALGSLGYAYMRRGRGNAAGAL